MRCADSLAVTTALPMIWRRSAKASTPPGAPSICGVPSRTVARYRADPLNARRTERLRRARSIRCPHAERDPSNLAPGDYYHGVHMLDHHIEVFESQTDEILLTSQTWRELSQRRVFILKIAQKIHAKLCAEPVECKRRRFAGWPRRSSVPGPCPRNFPPKRRVYSDENNAVRRSPISLWDWGQSECERS
jgi:hypothetical protein